MTRTFVLLTLLVGCSNGPREGTQIGVENTACEVESLEDWTEGTTVPDGFEQSLDDVLAIVEGAFQGPTLDASGAATSQMLTLNATAGPATLERRLDRIRNGFGDVCPDRLLIPLELELSFGDGTWSGPAELRIDQDGAIAVAAPIADAGAFPSPTTFDRNADYTWFSLDLEVDETGWQVEGTWHFENGSANPQSADAYQTETLFSGLLQ